MPQCPLKWKYLFSLLLLISLSLTVHGQQDTLLLDFAELNWKDIKRNKKQQVGTRVISGSRTEKNIEDLPFTIFVITGEEIRQKGYLTLTDVLKRLPGIRVSQPGSAIDGETFLMRGLHGNTYAKILINDIPIKPFVAKGMPIGPQIPIREAERIEIIYGPAATLYGADASAGVINIILKETDRPVYVQSDLGFGGNGFKNLDIMFAGKLGKDKRVMSFRVYGNYTSQDDRRVKYDTDSLYNPDRYQEILEVDPEDEFSYSDRPNYKGVGNVPLLGTLPHLSNTLGLDLKYRNFEFSLQQMTRRDHSSIGLSPYAVSYANPLNYFGERINVFNFNYEKVWKRHRIKASVGSLLYQTDKRSSYSYILPLVNFIHQIFADSYLSSSDPVALDSMRQVIDDTYFSGSRFSSANSAEYNLELFYGYTPNKHLELSSGLILQSGQGNPLRNYSSDPSNALTPTILDGGIQISDVSYRDVSGFLEAYFNIGKWNAILGTQAFIRQNNYLVRDRLYLNPRVALQYKWKKNFSLRFSAGRSFRYPSPYYASTSVRIPLIEFKPIETGADLSPEQTYSTEVGFRWRLTPKINMDFSSYLTRTTNFIVYLLSINSYSYESFDLGYVNDTDAFARLYGIQSRIRFENIIPAIGLSSTLNINYSQGREVSGAINFTGDLNKIDLDGLRSQPDWIGQVDIELHPTKRLRFLFENTWMTKSYTRNILLYQVPELLDNEDQLRNNGYFTIDALASYQFNKNILGYIKMNNVLSTKYAGIDATDDGDGLLYNPQTKRYTRIGINYRLQ